mmetsp:Transcript_16598/g.55337  ORF Transcript_16598/g.55337 Transcript_16598/m.55337 type:complete len:333 (-) Transcript_16598:884-1882(-)
MNPICKVYDGRALGERVEISLGGENKHFLLEEILLYAVQKLLRVVELLHPLDQLPQPCEPARLLHTLGFSLVHPVSSYSLLCYTVHLRRPDLNFDALATRPDDGRVERSIHVGLRERDVVLEPPRDRLPHAVNDAEGLVALTQVVGQDPERYQVLHFADMLQPAASHLLIDGVEMFRSASHHDVGKALVHQALLQDLHDLVGVGLPLLLLRRHHHLEFLVDLGLEVAQARIFQLRLHPENAEAVSEGSIQVQRLSRHLLLLLRRDELEGADVVRPVRQLHEDDADVAGHGDDHLAEVLCLLLLLGRELNLADLRHPVDQLRHLRPELLLYQL